MLKRDQQMIAAVKSWRQLEAILEQAQCRFEATLLSADEVAEIAEACIARSRAADVHGYAA